MKAIVTIFVCILMSACAKSNDSVSTTNPLSGEYILYSVSTCDTSKVALIVDLTTSGKSVSQGYQYTGAGCTGDRSKYGNEVVQEYRIALQSGSNFILENQNNPKTYSSIKIVDAGLQLKNFNTYDEALAFIDKDWSKESVGLYTRIK